MIFERFTKLFRQLQRKLRILGELCGLVKYDFRRLEIFRSDQIAF